MIVSNDKICISFPGFLVKNVAIMALEDLSSFPYGPEENLPQPRGES